MTGSDDALQTLLLPFLTGQLQWNNDALFLRARYDASLSLLASKQIICEQSFKPEAEMLQRAGFNVSPEVSHDDDKKFSLVLILPPRQRDEAKALFARAMSSLRPNGVVIAAVSNNDGARSLEDDLAKLAGGINTHSKNKCRVFWSMSNHAPIDEGLPSKWKALDQSRPILNGRYVSRPGVFAWDRIDMASALLAKHLPADLNGNAADLGAGFGYLSDELLQRSAGIKSLHVYEAEHRALQLSKINLARHEPRVAINYHWHDVTTGLPQQYDVIVTNPPFHVQGSRERSDIGRRFIAVAAQSLNPCGKLFLVANRHLPYEQALADGFDSMKVLTEQQGFKVIVATKNQAAAKQREKKPPESKRARK